VYKLKLIRKNALGYIVRSYLGNGVRSGWFDC